MIKNDLILKSAQYINKLIICSFVSVILQFK